MSWGESALAELSPCITVPQSPWCLCACHYFFLKGSAVYVGLWRTLLDVIKCWGLINYTDLFHFFPSFPLQIDVTYNVPDPIAKPAFQLLVNLKEPKSEQHLQAPNLLRSVSPDENYSEALHRERARGDDDDPASDQDHQEYKVILETCTR